MKLVRDRVAITGTEELVSRLAEGLREAGASPMPFPTIALSTIKTEGNISGIRRIGTYQWLVFTSRQGVHSFFQLAGMVDLAELPETLSVAVIGEKTGETLETYGHTPAFINPGRNQTELAKAWGKHLKPGDRILLAVSTLADDRLEDLLPEEVHLDRLEIYDNRVPALFDPEILEEIRRANYHWLIATSPSAIRNLRQMTGEWPDGEKIISIGPSTTSALREWGIVPFAEADEPSAEAIVACWKNLQPKPN